MPGSRAGPLTCGTPPHNKTQSCNGLLQMPPMPLSTSCYFVNSAKATTRSNNQSVCPQLLSLLNMILSFFQDSVPHGFPNSTPKISNKPHLRERKKKKTLANTHGCTFRPPLCLQQFPHPQHLDSAWKTFPLSNSMVVLNKHKAPVNN